MFWNSKNKALGTSPMKIDRITYEVIGGEWDKIPKTTERWVKYMAVFRPRAGAEDNYDVRVFDEYASKEKMVRVINYGSLDNHPEFIIFDGWINTKEKKGDIKYKKAA